MQQSQLSLRLIKDRHRRVPLARREVVECDFACQHGLCIGGAGQAAADIIVERAWVASIPRRRAFCANRHLARRSCLTEAALEGRVRSSSTQASESVQPRSWARQRPSRLFDVCRGLLGAVFAREVLARSETFSRAKQHSPLPSPIVRGRKNQRLNASTPQRINASISSAFTGTPREISSQPSVVTMASSSMRMPM